MRELSGLLDRLAQINFIPSSAQPLNTLEKPLCSAPPSLPPPSPLPSPAPRLPSRCRPRSTTPTATASTSTPRWSMGKKNKANCVRQADPDNSFGGEPLKKIFHKADVVTTPAVLEKINAKLAGKLAFWGPKMGANAPRTPVLPKAIAGNTLSVDGQTVEIRGTTGLLAHRPYAWIPSIKAVVGTIGVFGTNTHVWTADTQTVAERSAWVAQLDEMAALQPTVVVPGHIPAGGALDAANISYTKGYLQAFEKNAAATKTSAELIEAMKKAY